MKYLLIRTVRMDTYVDEFTTAKEAIKAGKNEWSHLSDYDRKKHKEFYVLESVNPDEDAEDHFDGNPIWDAREWEQEL